MKKTVLLFCACFYLYNIQAQVPSSCTIPQLLANEYERDIVQLATKRIFDLQSPDTTLVRIPQLYIDTISEGLAAIFNATSIPERDSVFNLYCVHNMNGWPFEYDGFLVQVDTSYSWTNAWQNLITMTGDPLMDTILTRYNLTITNFYNWGIGNYAELSVNSSWNPFALADSIEMVNGVLYAEQNYLIGSAGKISYSIIENTRYYDFYFEFQDCFDGCDSYRMWKFKVNPDCSVDYLGFVDWSFWWPIFVLDPPINCNIFTPVQENNNEKVNCFIYPNPSNGKFQFELDGFGVEKNSTLEIYNMQGEIIHLSEIASPKSEIDLSNQTKGIYFIKFFDGKTIFTQKFIIQ